MSTAKPPIKGPPPKTTSDDDGPDWVLYIMVGLCAAVFVLTCFAVAFHW